MFKVETDTSNNDAVFLICDNAIAHAGLAQILSGSGFRVVDTLATAPALCLIDASTPSETVLETVRAIKSQLPLIKIALLGDEFGRDFVVAAISADVDGFCSTKSKPEVLIKSLELVVLGEKMLPVVLVQALLSQASLKHPPMNATVDDNSSDPRVQKLSPREKAILQAIMGGDPNKVIARKLDVAEATVKVHVKAILRKVGAANRTQAAMWAAAHFVEADRPSSENANEGQRLN
jgi:two-component system, NarL family, nitrate/nitrite response regulator NarL